MLRKLWVIVLLALPLTAFSQSIYKWLDEEGQVNYGNSPPPNASNVEVIFDGSEKPDEPAQARIKSENVPTISRSYKEKEPRTEPRPAAKTNVFTGITAMANQASQVFLKLAFGIFGLGFILLGLKILLVAKLKGSIGEWQVQLALSSLGYPLLNDVLLPIGDDQYTQVDHILFTPVGLIVIETKNYAGLIFGSTKDTQWTQKLGKKTFKFQNPGRQNYKHIQAIKNIVNDVPIHSLVVFTQRSKFPKGLPLGVVQLYDLGKNIKSLMSQPQIEEKRLSLAYDDIELARIRDKKLHKMHIVNLQKQYGGGVLGRVGYGSIVVGVLLTSVLICGWV